MPNGATVAAPAPAPATPAPTGSLTRRATLNAAAGMLDYVSRAAVGLWVTPILVHGLGRSLFGVWEILTRLVGYMSVADGRPTEALRLVIANRQAADPAEQRRAVGTALAVWLCMLPVVVAIGVALITLAPVLIEVAPDTQPAVRLATGLLAVGFLMTGLAALPESVLRGMNLGYRRMWLQAGLSVVGGLLAVGAIDTGLGLVGLAGATVIRAVLTGVCFWGLARSYVAWFGAARPARGDVPRMLGMSLWLMAGDLIAKVLLASDVVLLGAVVSPAAVAAYALTGYAARTAVGLHFFTVGAAMPGLGGLIGRSELDRAAAARSELQVLTWLFATSVGAVILMWNRSFVSLWVSPDLYAGVWVDLLIVLITVQTFLIRTDAYVLDAALQPRARVLVGAAAAALTILVSLPLTRAFGVVGLCVGLLIGRSVQSIAYPLLVRSHLGPAPSPFPVRLAAVTALLFTAAAATGRRVTVESWGLWTLGVAASLALCGGFALLAGPPAPVRRRLLHRLASLRRRGLGGTPPGGTP